MKEMGLSRFYLGLMFFAYPDRTQKERAIKYLSDAYQLLCTIDFRLAILVLFNQATFNCILRNYEDAEKQTRFVLCCSMIESLPMIHRMALFNLATILIKKKCYGEADELFDRLLSSGNLTPQSYETVATRQAACKLLMVSSTSRKRSVDDSDDDTYCNYYTNGKRAKTHIFPTQPVDANVTI
jgi:hypothetical protein